MQTKTAHSTEKSIKNRICKIISHKYTAGALLTIVIILQLFHIVNVYSRGNNYLCDEVYTFGLSNSFYKPAMELSGFRSNMSENINTNKWISGKELFEYITVQPGEQFRYDSVWYNQSLDRHPPFYYAVLHTIYSFIPDTFSYWPAFCLNVLCFIITQIYFYRLIKLMLKSRYLAILICFFWGLTSASVTSVLFIRMYAMLIMWVIMFLFYNEKLSRSETRKQKKKYLILCTAILTLGTLTQYLFLFVAFIDVLGYCLKYLINKRFKFFLLYGFGMLSGVIAAFLIFPSAIFQLMEESRHNTWETFLIQLPIAFRYLSLNMIGIGINLSSLKFYILALFPIIAILYVISLPLQYLFRDRECVKNFYRNIGNFFKRFRNVKKIRTIDLNRSVKKFTSFCKKSSPLLLIMIISSLTVITVTAYKMSFITDDYIIRYLFLICPLVVSVVAYVLYVLIRKFKFKKIFMTALVILLSFLAITKAPFRYSEVLKSEINNPQEQFADSQCVIILPSERYIPVFCVIPKELRTVDSYFLTYYPALDDNLEELNKADRKKELYLLFCENTDLLPEEKIEIYLERISNVLNTKTKLLGKWKVPNCTYLVYHADFMSIDSSGS